MAMAVSPEYQQYNGTEEEKRSLIMEVYYPFIIETVRSTDILAHLVELQDHFSELRNLDKEGKHVQSMMMLLRFLDASKKPQKWSPFIDALKSAGYQDLYRGLEYGEDIPMMENATKYNLILRFLPTLIERIRLENSGILPLLYQHKVISEHQLESIRACIRNYSNQDAILELILHLHKKTKEWYTVFLEALLQDGQNDLVQNIDPEFMLGKKRKKRMTFNFDSLDYEEDHLSVDGEAEDGVFLCSTPSNSSHEEPDRTGEELSDSQQSAPYSSPAKLGIRDFEVVFPPFPKCPRVDLTDENMLIQLIACLNVSVENTCLVAHQGKMAAQALELLSKSLQCWESKHFKPWCDNMEKYIEVNSDFIKNRDDLIYLVNKWLLQLQSWIQNDYGEVDNYNSQIETLTQIVETFSEIGSCFKETLTETKKVKEKINCRDTLVLQHVINMIQQIRNGEQDSIENFLSDDLNVAGVNCGKVVKCIGRMWNDLK